jgi:hypothetical protein
MSGYSMMETQFKITGPNGTVIYAGTGRVSSFLEVALNDTNPAQAAEGLIVDSAATVVGLPVNTAAATEVIAAKRIVDANSVGFLGVTIDGIRARTGASGIGMTTGRVAGSGSIVPVRCTAAAIAAGTPVVSSGTAGQVVAAGAKSASVPAYGTVLGMCVVARATVNGVDICSVLVGPQ